jgi:predicted Fe-S protein YdhL (DUF1289 family)
MESPCVKICKLDPKLQYCLGCKRTVEEIQKWTYYTPEQRQKIIKELLGR